MPFNIRFPARFTHLGRLDDGTIVFSPGLEVLVHTGVDPILVLSNRYFAVVGRNRLGNPTEIRNGVVVDPNPVADVAAGHSFDVEIIAKRQCRHEDGYSRGQIRITTVMKVQSLSRKVQFGIDAGETLNMEGNLGAVKPVGVAPAKLPVAQRLPAIHRSDCVVLLPQVLERLTLLCQGAVDFFRVEIPVDVRIH